MLYVILFLMLGLKLEMSTAYFVVLGIIAVISTIRSVFELAKALK